jgi:hypothetical protein
MGIAFSGGEVVDLSRLGRVDVVHSAHHNRKTEECHEHSVYGMASAANESHATSSASIDEENWKYVECAKCREGAVLQDKQDPNSHVIRADFQLTACGHVACLKCLQGL